VSPQAKQPKGWWTFDITFANLITFMLQTQIELHVLGTNTEKQLFQAAKDV
jgi:hypothetical protein